MAYVIGSQKGKDKAEEMKINDTYTASDGSVWKKESDGSITVTQNGNTYKNAYQSDYSTTGKNQMENDASWQEVQRTLNNRVNKALTTPGLEKYAYDNVYTDMYNYIRSKQDEEARAGYESVTRPDDYSSKYRDDIDDLLREILSRDDFSYNVEEDPLYQQYRTMYQREGDRAMRETLAEAASGAGGMNTYAITAASQANNYYNSQLNDKIPELYKLAYDMYLQDKESKVQDLGLLQDMDATQYARYRDTMNDFYADRNFAYGEYQDTITRNDNALRDQRDFTYGDYWQNKEYTDNRSDIDYERTQAEKETAYNTIVDQIDRGVTTFDPNLMAQAGVTQQQVDQMVKEHQAELAKSKSSGGGGGGGGNPKYNPTPVIEGDEWKQGLTDLGLGSIFSADLLVDLEEAGAIYEEDGKLEWSDGWNKDNYMTRLNLYKMNRADNPYYRFYGNA